MRMKRNNFYFFLTFFCKYFFLFFFNFLMKENYDEEIEYNNEDNEKYSTPRKSENEEFLIDNLNNNNKNEIALKNKINENTTLSNLNIEYFYDPENIKEEIPIVKNREELTDKYLENFDLLRESLVLEEEDLKFGKTNLLKTKIEKTENSNKTYVEGIWSSLKSKVSVLTSSISNSLNINVIPFKKEKDYPGEIKIFEKTFINNHYFREFYRKYKRTLFYFSTRNKFIKPVYKDNVYFISDYIWGNLFRCFQMIFANLFCEIKMKEYLIKNLNINLNNEEIRKTLSLFIDEVHLNEIKYDILILFMDNPLKIETLIQNDNFTFFFKEKFHKTLESIDNFDNNAFKVSQVMSPFSIDMLYKSSNYFKYISRYNYLRNAGEINLMSLNIMNAFNEIINQYNLFDRKINIINFNNEIEEEKILNKCFIKVIDIHNEKINNLYECKGQYYKYNEGVNCLMFVKVKLGKMSIKDEYVKNLPNYFKIQGNKGFIGKISEKENDYAYFIGETDGILLGISPNNNLDSINDINELIQKDKFSTFELNENNLFLINYCDISPFIIFVFQFTCLDEYKSLIVDIKKHVNEKYPLLKIKAIKTDSIDLFSSSILNFDNTLSKLPDSFNEISRISYKSNHSNDSF